MIHISRSLIHNRTVTSSTKQIILRFNVTMRRSSNVMSMRGIPKKNVRSYAFKPNTNTEPKSLGFF